MYVINEPNVIAWSSPCEADGCGDGVFLGKNITLTIIACLQAMLYLGHTTVQPIFMTVSLKIIRIT